MNSCNQEETTPFLLQYDAVRCFSELIVPYYGTIKHKVYNKGKVEKTIEYLNLICSFDIETSSFTLGGRKVACMYSWQFGINGRCYVGRTWADFERCMKQLVDVYNLSKDRRLIIWVQNLPYEFQWIYKRLNFIEVFAREEREPMKALADNGLEFRCSYVLSGCNLASMAKNLTMYNIRKLVGDLDYKKIRGSNTPLRKKELQYCINDVLVVMAYIVEQVHLYGDLTKIPMTNTGRVRKACRKRCLGKVWGLAYHNLMKRLIITDVTEYEALRRAFLGGFTHANWKRVKDIIKKVYSRDFTSSYPTVMIAEKFPMGKAEVKNGLSVEELERLRHTNKIVFNVKFFNLREKENVYDNPLSVSKCKIIGKKCENNGRLISADLVITTTTDVDFFDIIQKFYEWDSIEIGACWIYPASYLPTPLVEMIVELYQDKTTLKDVKEKVLEYLIKKGMLNSTYGMSVMAIISEVVELLNGEWKTDNSKTMEESIKEYNEDTKRFLFYPWGVFITAYARRNLFSGIYELGADYIYADTDSVKFTNYEKHKDYFDRYNAWITKKIEHALKCHNIPVEMARPKTIYGEEKPLGVWDDDGFYLKFKTLGAKRYMYLCDNKKQAKKENKPQKLELHTTVAGVSKSGLAEYMTYLQKHYGGNKAFDFFDDEMDVPARFAHKTTALYIDEEANGTFTDYLGNTCEFDEKSFVHLSESSYNMKLTEIYKLLLEGKEKIMY